MKKKKYVTPDYMIEKFTVSDAVLTTSQTGGWEDGDHEYDLDSNGTNTVEF